MDESVASALLGHLSHTRRHKVNSLDPTTGSALSSELSAVGPTAQGSIMATGTLTTTTRLGIIGAGELRSQLARAAIRSGYTVGMADSRGPETLRDLVQELGPSAGAGSAAEVASWANVVIISVPLKLTNDMPTEQLAGKIVLDTNNYMPWRDGHYEQIDSGQVTEHDLRQQQLPEAMIAKAFILIQAPRLFELARPEGTPQRHALSVSSNFPRAVEFVTQLYDQFGFDTVDHNPRGTLMPTRRETS